ncbi:hypothetical protein AVEN_248641-1 [Araneus ventricosus]|uniref:Uncharacterized protein n=1 Tax=Araneus ventricosus TaxID=182803 RepID=A0A4Y2C1P8_ARAVE|nr:hypothetical protein AVEN_248641-1 [Araneus ventricosus]
MATSVSMVRECSHARNRKRKSNRVIGISGTTMNSTSRLIEKQLENAILLVDPDTTASKSAKKFNTFTELKETYVELHLFKMMSRFQKTENGSKYVVTDQTVQRRNVPLQISELDREKLPVSGQDVQENFETFPPSDIQMLFGSEM